MNGERTMTTLYDTGPAASTWVKAALLTIGLDPALAGGRWKLFLANGPVAVRVTAGAARPLHTRKWAGEREGATWKGSPDARTLGY
jgi:hypothetical protein